MLLVLLSGQLEKLVGVSMKSVYVDQFAVALPMVLVFNPVRDYPAECCNMNQAMLARRIADCISEVDNVLFKLSSIK